MNHERITEQLEEARARTLHLVEPLDTDDLHRQHDPLMSPIMWDLGHIAHFEELWLVRNLDGPVQFGEMPGIYNPFEHPRRERGELELLPLDACCALMAEVRSRVLERMSKADGGSENPLLRDGYVYAMVLQHEYQHNETILQTLQLKQGAPYRAPRAYSAPRAGSAKVTSGTMVRFPGGDVELGTDDRTVAYDNERPRHEISAAPFSIDVFPVTNGDYLEFMRAGGYSRRDLWSDAGWQWLSEAEVEAPKYWEREGDEWCVRTMDDTHPVPRDHAVCHVSYHEADAFARFAGKRLPTEQEWEIAAGWNRDGKRMQSFPWGDAPADPSQANIDQLSFATTPIGAYAQNWSPLGCYGMIGRRHQNHG